MTIHAAEKVDQGLQAARTDISAIKIAVPAAYSRVVDRAIQVWGAAGVSNDLPLASMYLGARTLRIADGPDEVHKVPIAKNVLGAYAEGQSSDFGRCPRVEWCLTPFEYRKRVGYGNSVSVSFTLG